MKILQFLIQLYSFQSSQVDIKPLFMHSIDATANQLNFEFDPNIDKTKNVDQKY